MTQEEKSRPVGGTGRPGISVGGDTPSLSDASPNLREQSNAAPLGDEEIAELVCRHPRARDVWSAGYSSGYQDGYEAAQLSQEQQADLAAQKFYVMEAHQEWLSRFVPATISAMEVEAYRRSPGSSYIPRKGDPRYSEVRR